MDYTEITSIYDGESFKLKIYKNGNIEMLPCIFLFNAITGESESFFKKFFVEDVKKKYNELYGV